jgi:FAD/FMN-containing dehydrogenase
MIERVKLAEIVGKGQVSTDPDVLAGYSQDWSFVTSIKPAYVVKPHKSAEIERLVKMARETQTPLVPVSSGPPHFRGDTVPGIGGAIMVDLSEMKKIIMVDRKNRSVMFEPGITFGELIPAVAKKGMRLNLPLLPRQSKSVVGSLLEREPVVMPKYHWDIADPTNCFEVVFGTGDVFRTGAAAGPGTIEEQWKAGGAQKEAAGPSATSWYRVIQGSQGTMGIVSWATARCELIPSREEPFLVGDSHLDKILDLVHWLIRLRLVNECFILNGTNLATILNMSPQENLPRWVLFFNIAAYEYLPEMRMKGQIEDMRGIAQKFSLAPTQAIANYSAFETLKAVQQPSGEPYWKLRSKGSCQDIFFITIYDKLPQLIETMDAEANQAGYPASQIGIYLQPIVQGTNCHCEFNLFYNPEDAAEKEQVKQLTARAVTSLMNKGAFFSRPYGENAHLIMNRDAATVAALQKVKSIVDPDRIMNPGKLCF